MASLPEMTLMLIPSFPIPFIVKDFKSHRVVPSLRLHHTVGFGFIDTSTQSVPGFYSNMAKNWEIVAKNSLCSQEVTDVILFIKIAAFFCLEERGAPKEVFHIPVSALDLPYSVVKDVLRKKTSEKEVRKHRKTVAGN